MNGGSVVGVTRRRTVCPHCGEEIVETFTAEQDRRLAEIFTRAADDLEANAVLEATWGLTPDPESDEEL